MVLISLLLLFSAISFSFALPATSHGSPLAIRRSDPSADTIANLKAGPPAPGTFWVFGEGSHIGYLITRSEAAHAPRDAISEQLLNCMEAIVLKIGDGTVGPDDPWPETHYQCGAALNLAEADAGHRFLTYALIAQVMIELVGISIDQGPEVYRTRFEVWGADPTTHARLTHMANGELNVGGQGVTKRVTN